MFTITVPADTLKALALCAADKDVRYYLRGVLIDTTVEGRVHLVTTDGHRMLVVGNATIEGEIVAGNFIVPIEALKGLKPYAKGGPICIDIAPSGSEGGAYTVRGALTTTGACIEGKYPLWRKVLPETRTLTDKSKVGHFNLEYVGDFGKASKTPRLQAADDRAQRPEHGRLGVPGRRCLRGADADALR